MLADRGVAVDHTTIYRWIQAYAPELGIRPHLRLTTGSWRVDETYFLPESICSTSKTPTEVSGEIGPEREAAPCRTDAVRTGREVSPGSVVAAAPTPFGAAAPAFVSAGMAVVRVEQHHRRRGSRRVAAEPLQGRTPRLSSVRSIL
jgi:hypothetical protein